jgi:hypothetical protein
MDDNQTNSIFSTNNLEDTSNNNQIINLGLAINGTNTTAPVDIDAAFINNNSPMKNNNQKFSFDKSDKPFQSANCKYTYNKTELNITTPIKRLSDINLNRNTFQNVIQKD